MTTPLRLGDLLAEQPASAAPKRAPLRLSDLLAPPADFSDVEGGASTLTTGQGAARMEGAPGKFESFVAGGNQGGLFGFADELGAAAAATMTGHPIKNYGTNLDYLRERFKMANEAHPKTEFAGELAGTIASPITKALGVIGPSGPTATTFQRVASGAASGAVGGAIAGAGNADESNRAGGAVIGGTVGLVAGTALPLAGRAVSATGGRLLDALNPERAVVREAAALIPQNAKEIAIRQEALAPGTVVPGTLSPELRAMSRVVGADAESGLGARLESEARFNDLKAGRRAIGQIYESVGKANERLPVDDEARAILTEAGSLPGESVSFETMHKLRSKLLSQARKTNDAAKAFDLNKRANRITTWLEQRVPDLRETDKVYAFLSDRLDAEKGLHKTITNSAQSYAAARTAGASPTSPGAQLVGSQGGIGATLLSILQPDRAARARAVRSVLLTPADGSSTTLDDILRARQRMGRQGTMDAYARTLADALAAQAGGAAGGVR